MIVIKRPVGLLLFISATVIGSITYASVNTATNTNTSTSTSRNSETVKSESGLDLTTTPIESIAFPELTNQQIGEYLGWMPDENAAQYCKGYFLEQPIDYTVQLPEGVNPDEIDPGKIPVQITAQEGDLFVKGKSSLTGDVQVSQFNRELQADSASLFRDDQGEIKQIDLQGRVHMQQPEKLVIADNASVPIEDGKVLHLTLNDVIYRVSLNSLHQSNQLVTPTDTESEANTPKKITSLVGWGRAKEVKEQGSDVLALKEATYSTCPPNDKACMWHISAYKLVIDKEKDQGRAYASTLWVKQVPVMFLPYFSFPLDDQRKSGFLYPSFMQSTNNGFSVSAPYYLNLAPNYDVTLTPTYYSQRGFYLGSQWRYLTPGTSGYLDAGIAPDDHKFADFKTNAESDYAGNPNLGDLEDSSTTRTGMHWVNNTILNKEWSSNIDFSYVSDDYYTEDFSQSFSQASNYQLLQKADVNYYGTHWTFNGLLNNYQTLHPVDQDTISNQYARLPELNFNADYPDQLSNTDLTWQSQFDYFYMEANPGDSTDPVIGSRLNLEPGISMPFRQSYGYITPSIELSTTAYQLQDEGAGNPSNPSRVLPLLDIDSGLYFDRDTTLLGHNYTQTLEPRLYYLYVPYTDQDDLPDFDSILYTLNYDRLFQNNRFSSVDRIGDANQFSLGLTSRFFDQDTGDEKLRFSIGDAWYLSDRKVSLCTSSACQQQDTEEFSPVVSTINYWLTPQWSINSDWAYDFSETMFDNGTLTIGYMKDRRRVINFGYSYAAQGNIYTSDTDDEDLYNLSQIHASYAWPLSEQWNSLGSIDLSPSYGNGAAYIMGLEYDACCWGLRFLMSQQLTGVENGENQYDTVYYMQFVLKGLGSLNSRNSSGLIAENINNYNDDFVRVF